MNKRILMFILFILPVYSFCQDEYILAKKGNKTECQILSISEKEINCENYRSGQSILNTVLLEYLKEFSNNMLFKGGSNSIPNGTLPDTTHPIPVRYRGSWRYVTPYTILIKHSWSNIIDVEAGTSYTDGELNTQKIVNQTGHINSAAKVCWDLVDFGYDDWYLPSFFELKAIYLQSYLLPDIGYSEGYYWSSSEKDSSIIWVENFDTGDISTTHKSTILLKVRCIRKDSE